jgi:hypothetical protein
VLTLLVRDTGIAGREIVATSGACSTTRFDEADTSEIRSGADFFTEVFFAAGFAADAGFFDAGFLAEFLGVSVLTK